MMVGILDKLTGNVIRWSDRAHAVIQPIGYYADMAFIDHENFIMIHETQEETPLVTGFKQADQLHIEQPIRTMGEDEKNPHLQWQKCLGALVLTVERSEDGIYAQLLERSGDHLWEWTLSNTPIALAENVSPNQFFGHSIVVDPYSGDLYIPYVKQDGKSLNKVYPHRGRINVDDDYQRVFVFDERVLIYDPSGKGEADDLHA